jgi:hypothetical protein
MAARRLNRAGTPKTTTTHQRRFPYSSAPEGRFMERIEYEVMEWIYNSQPYEWVLILFGVIVIGAICMKSGSNKSNF